MRRAACGHRFEDREVSKIIDVPFRMGTFRPIPGSRARSSIATKLAETRLSACGSSAPTAPEPPLYVETPDEWVTP